MFSYEENVRAILQCFFSQSKDELIEGAVKSIMAIKQEPVVVNPINPTTVPLPYYPYPNITNPNITPYITCAETDRKPEKTAKF